LMKSPLAFVRRFVFSVQLCYNEATCKIESEEDQKYEDLICRAQDPFL